MAEQTTMGRGGTAEEDRLARLEAQVAALTRELGRLQDVNAIRKLQHSYGYFMDKGLYDEVVDLFAEDGELRFMGGVFKGKAGLRRLYCERLRPGFTGHNGPAFGLLCDHMQLQDVITVAADGLTAKARWRAFLQGGSHDLKPDINPAPAAPVVGGRPLREPLRQAGRRLEGEGHGPQPHLAGGL